MITKFVEATNGFNYGKFMVAQFDDEEWRQPSRVDELDGQGRHSLVARCGWGRYHTWVLDVQTGEGAMFSLRGKADYDLNEKHAVWVCPLFQPFLNWLYEQAKGGLDIAQLPEVVTLDPKHSALYGFRRAGTDIGGGEFQGDWAVEYEIHEREDDNDLTG